MVSAFSARAESQLPVFSAPTLPAVSAPNGAISIFGGQWPDAKVGGGAGSFAFPLGMSFGVQIDAQAGRSKTESVNGSAGHLFWRDPALGLIGLYHTRSFSSYEDGFTVNADKANVKALGVESEVYLDRITLKLRAGQQSGKFEGTTAKATLAYYATDNVKLDLTLNQIHGVGRQASIGAQWAPFPSYALTLFGRAGVGEDRYVSAMGGIEFDFGAPPKTLIRHHREDLIDNDLPENLFEAIGDGTCPIGAHHRNGFCDGNI